MTDRAVRITQRSARRTTLRAARPGTISGSAETADGAVTGPAPMPTAEGSRADGGGRGTGDTGVPGSEVITSLRMLAQLRDEGVLSYNEFVAAKARVLGI